MNEHLEKIRGLADIIHSDFDFENITYKKARYIQVLIDNMQEELDKLTSELIKEEQRH